MAWDPRGCDMARGSATWTHASACMSLMWRGCVAGQCEPRWMPRLTGIVGPGRIIGAVTYLRKEAPPFILAYSVYFLCVGLCSLLISYLQDTWHNNARWIGSLLKIAR